MTALDEVPVVGGQVVSTLRVVFTFAAGSPRNPSGRAHGTSVPWVVSPLMERVGSVIRSRAHYPCI